MVASAEMTRTIEAVVDLVRQFARDKGWRNPRIYARFSDWGLITIILRCVEIDPERTEKLREELENLIRATLKDADELFEVLWLSISNLESDPSGAVPVRDGSDMWRIAVPQS